MTYVREVTKYSQDVVWLTFVCDVVKVEPHSIIKSIIIYSWYY